MAKEWTFFTIARLVLSLFALILQFLRSISYFFVYKCLWFRVHIYFYIMRVMICSVFCFVWMSGIEIWEKKTVNENEYFALWYGRDHIELLCYLLFLVHIFWLVCFSFVTTTSTAIWINNNIYNIRNYCPLRCCNKERHNMILNIAICWFVSRYKFYSL